MFWFIVKLIWFGGVGFGSWSVRWDWFGRFDDSIVLQIFDPWASIDPLSAGFCFWCWQLSIDHSGYESVLSWNRFWIHEPPLAPSACCFVESSPFLAFGFNLLRLDGEINVRSKLNSRGDKRNVQTASVSWEGQRKNNVSEWISSYGMIKPTTNRDEKRRCGGTM